MSHFRDSRLISAWAIMDLDNSEQKTTWRRVHHRNYLAATARAPAPTATPWFSSVWDIALKLHKCITVRAGKRSEMWQIRALFQMHFYCTSTAPIFCLDWQKIFKLYLDVQIWYFKHEVQHYRSMQVTQLVPGKLNQCTQTQQKVCSVSHKTRTYTTTKLPWKEEK